MADGYGFGGEGDWKTSVLVRTLKVMAEGLPGGTSFMEDYTYHLEPGNELVLGAHMLEVCPTLSSTPARVEIHPLGIGAREDPVRLVFTADPGEAVLLGMSDLGDRFRLVGNEVTVVTPPQDMPKLPVGRAVWQPKPDFATSTEGWLLAGGPHHTVMSTALTTTHLDHLAEILGLELAVIGEGTTTRGFRQELRWNRAYHLLAGGL
jgi:L-arabinose isomerase